MQPLMPDQGIGAATTGQSDNPLDKLNTIWSLKCRLFAVLVEYQTFVLPVFALGTIFNCCFCNTRCGATLATSDAMCSFGRS
jgi:hypothetical protein